MYKRITRKKGSDDMNNRLDKQNRVPTFCYAPGIDSLSRGRLPLISMFKSKKKNYQNDFFIQCEQEEGMSMYNIIIIVLLSIDNEN